MADRLQTRKASRFTPNEADTTDDTTKFLSRIGLTSLARNRKVKTIRKKLASAEIGHTTEYVTHLTITISTPALVAHPMSVCVALSAAKRLWV